MRNYRIILVICLGLLSLAACTTEEEPASSDSIQDIVWQWESVNNKPASDVMVLAFG